jgi:hypothetical protein
MHGWITMSWSSTLHVLEFNDFHETKKLNRALVRSTFQRYTFRGHAMVHHPILCAAVQRLSVSRNANSTCFEDEEDEAQERCPVADVGRQQFPRSVGRKGRFTDDRDAEARRGERIRHSV